MATQSSTSDLSTASKASKQTNPTIALPISAIAFTAGFLFSLSWIGAVVAASILRNTGAFTRAPPYSLPSVSDVSQFPDAHPIYVIGISMSGFFIAQTSLFLHLATEYSKEWHAKLATFALVGQSIGGILLTIGSGTYITVRSHAGLLGSGTLLIWMWMLVMSHVLKGKMVWIGLLRVATLSTILGFGFTMRAAATKGAALLAVGEFLILSGISVYLFGIGGYMWGVQIGVRLDVLGKEVVGVEGEEDQLQV